MNKSILIIAPHDKHLNNFSKHLQEIKYNEYSVDHFALSYGGENAPFRETLCLKKHFPAFFYRYFAGLLIYIDVILTFRKIKTHYDLINIHFVTLHSFFLLPFLKKKAAKLILTPWGSDALRVNHPVVVWCLRKLYAAADYVTLANIRFRQDVLKKFNFDPNKIVELSYGAEMIDVIAEELVEPAEAKRRIGFPDSFIITVGYNRSPLQNHRSIIQAIIACKDQLPENLCVAFPFTYNGTLEPYKSELKSILDEAKIDSVFFESFLSNEKLRDLIYATDLFVHAQETDANSASMQEYLLAGKTVVNGSWLQYDQLEKISKPYYSAQDKNTIEQSLQEVIDNQYNSKVTDYHIEEIKKFGWKQKAKEWNQFFSNLS